LSLALCCSPLRSAAPIQLDPVTVTGEKIARFVGETSSGVLVAPAERQPPVPNRAVLTASCSC
jgi:hypothetical protein